MHLEAMQASFLSETNVYLGYTCYFWWPSWVWQQDAPPPPPNIILHQKRVRRHKISGLEVLL